MEEKTIIERTALQDTKALKSTGSQNMIKLFANAFKSP